MRSQKKIPSQTQRHHLTEERSAAFFTWVLDQVEQQQKEKSKTCEFTEDDLIGHEVRTKADMLPDGHTRSTELSQSVGDRPDNKKSNRLENEFKHHDSNEQKEVRKMISNMRYLDRVSSSNFF